MKIMFHIKKKFIFLHISTDEVYGELGKKGKFKESTPYDPRNPYSASKASSDMLVRSYYHTYGLNVTISNCSNNYGPNQHREKFIPTIIDSLLNDIWVPIYGEGKNVRDWIFVEDHCEALWKILTKGKSGETYNVGANCEKQNIEIVKKICDVLNKDFKSIVFHDAYQYFEKRFDVLAAGSISLGDISDPSPARIAEVRNKVEELGITCVFSEPQFNPELVRTVADGTSVTTREIDPLGTTFTLGPDFYLDVLRSIAQTMASCL